MKQNAHGFTLVELMIVAAIACILIPVSFLGFSRLSDELTMRHFMEEVSAVLSEAQMEAISESVTVLIIFDHLNDRYIVSKNMAGVERAMDPQITVGTNIGNSIIVNRRGRFYQSGTFIFSLRNVYYRLVLNVGQGRHRIERIYW